MVTRQVVLDPEGTAVVDGVIQIRFRKRVVEDGKVLSYEYHRTSLEPGMSLASQMSTVNAHLVRMGWTEVSVADIARLQAIVAVEHTPARVAEFRAARAGREIAP